MRAPCALGTSSCRAQGERNETDKVPWRRVTFCHCCREALNRPTSMIITTAAGITAHEEDAIEDIFSSLMQTTKKEKRDTPSLFLITPAGHLLSQQDQGHYEAACFFSTK